MFWPLSTLCSGDRRRNWSVEAQERGARSRGPLRGHYRGRRLYGGFVSMFTVSSVVVSGRRRVSSRVTKRPVAESRPTFFVVLIASSSQILSGLELRVGGRRHALRECVERGQEESQRVAELRRHQRQRRAEALTLFDELGVDTERVRVEWAIAGIAVARGDLETADKLLASVRSRLQQLGLRNDHALATLEWVEVRLALNRMSGVVAACREILLQFDSEGMMRNARLALAHLHQALARQSATPQLVYEIRAYLKELPARPEAVFAPSQQ